MARTADPGRLRRRIRPRPTRDTALHAEAQQSQDSTQLRVTQPQGSPNWRPARRPARRAGSVYEVSPTLRRVSRVSKLASESRLISSSIQVSSTRIESAQTHPNMTEHGMFWASLSIVWARLSRFNTCGQLASLQVEDVKSRRSMTRDPLAATPRTVVHTRWVRETCHASRKAQQSNIEDTSAGRALSKLGIINEIFQHLKLQYRQA